MARRETTPPRPIRPGDVVVGYSDDLDAWSAVQVTHLDPQHGQAGVLDLDWSGPQPSALDDLGPLRPLTLTGGGLRGRLSHVNTGWVLPRGCSVVGTAPVLVDRPPSMYTSGWNLGVQLSMERRRDAGGQGRPGYHRCTAADLPAGTSAAQTWGLIVTDIVDLDCRQLAERFPALTKLSMTGALGTLRHTHALQSLTRLRHLSISDLFGMDADDCPRPESLVKLESFYVDSVPAEFAAAARRWWVPQVVHGTDVAITRPRAAGWVEANRDNPLREWDGREHISAARYAKAVARYRTTRQAVVDVLAVAGGHSGERLTALGREYGEAFNRLDGARNPFIETEEREDLAEALAATVTFAEASLGRSFPDAREHLLAGVDAVRQW